MNYCGVPFRMLLRVSMTMASATMALLVFRATAASPEVGVEFFEKSIRPVLIQHCYECHSASAAANGKQQAGLMLDSKQGFLQGGESGPAVVPGKPQESLLISALNFESVEMPPKGRLPAEVIANFEKWVAMGAPDPRDDRTNLTPRRTEFQITDDDRQHWSFRPLTKTEPPDVKQMNWGKGDIDRFVLANIERTGGQPSPIADRYTLLRRTTFAITGLAPTAEEIAAFISDTDAAAFEKVVDRLLDSPDYGIHWGRRWLDGVCYADSIDKSGEYRRWVVRALNADLPYDQFLKMQIAGDLIPASSSVPHDQKHVSGASFDGITATGMMAMAVWEQVGRDLAVAEIVDSQIDIIGRQVLGLTLACARCHDHKFDPISTQDYYALAGILFSSHISVGKLIADDRLSTDALVEMPLLNMDQDNFNRQLDSKIAQVESRISLLAMKVPQAAKLAELSVQLADLDGQLVRATTSASKKSLTDQTTKMKVELEKLLADQQTKAWDKNPPEIELIANLRKEIDGLRKEKVKAAAVVAIADGGVPGSNREKIGDAPIYLRGEYQREGAIVPRRFPVILAGPDQTALGERTKGSGRYELAEWIAAPENPLTARVMVNRIWQQMIGRALVRSPDNFGKLGEKPTHPELLDYLAAEFMASDWSVKKLVRQIALSATFQQTSLVPQAAARMDPDNLLISHMNRRRLTYEELRDFLLRLASGGQPGSVDGDVRKRTMFEAIDRKKIDLTAAIFDGPDSKSIIPIRAESTTAQQALYLMNSQLAHDTAKKLAERITEDPALKSDHERLERLWMLVFGRQPDGEETRTSQEFIAAQSWESLVLAILGTNEAVYID